MTYNFEFNYKDCLKCFHCYSKPNDVAKRENSLNQTIAQYNRHATLVPDIPVSSRGAVQNTPTRNFDIYGCAIDIDKFCKYVIKSDKGSELIRNCKVIRKRIPASLNVHYTEDLHSEPNDLGHALRSLRNVGR